MHGDLRNACGNGSTRRPLALHMRCGRQDLASATLALLRPSSLPPFKPTAERSYCRGTLRRLLWSCRLGLGLLRNRGAFGRDQVVASFDEIMKRTRSRIAVASLPAGTYVFEDVTDDDGLGTENIVIKLTIDPAAPRLLFDSLIPIPQVLGVDAIEFLQLAADFEHAHAARIHGYDLGVAIGKRRSPLTAEIRWTPTGSM